MPIHDINTIINAIKRCKFQMFEVSKDEMNEYNINNKSATYYSARAQEYIICNVLNNMLPSHLYCYPVMKYLKLKKYQYTPWRESRLGDIIIVDKSSANLDAVCCLEIKVADDGEHPFCHVKNRYFVGCINQTSYNNFAMNTTGKPRVVPHLYLCLSYEGSEFVIVDSSRLVECVERCKKQGEKVFVFGGYDENGKPKYYIQSYYIFNHENEVCV